MWRGRPRPRSAAQPIANALGGHSRNADDFIPASLTGRNGNGRTRHLQKFRQEFNAGLVGSTLDGRSGERDFERIADLASDAGLLSAWMNFHGETYSIAVVANPKHDLTMEKNPVILSEVKNLCNPPGSSQRKRRTTKMCREA